jgi:hypothetical protein
LRSTDDENGGSITAQTLTQQVGARFLVAGSSGPGGRIEVALR